MVDRKYLSLLLAILLVVTMTSQAALAFSMPCRGTSHCCCSTPSMDMTAAMPGGMAPNCCATSPEKPCDIQTTTPVSAEPYLANSTAGHVDSELVFHSTAIHTGLTDVQFLTFSPFWEFPDRGDPPVYLQNLTFLC